jgi:radical SAM-linked protein
MMESPYKMRLRITFAKTDAMRYTGHLAVRSTWERTMRRAGLPLSYSQGYNPHPKFNLASPLPLGFTSESEMIDVWMGEHVPLDEIRGALESAMPPGLALIEVEEVDLHAEKLPNLLQAATFTVTLLEHEPDLETRIAELRQGENIPWERRGKPFNLRELIEAIRLGEPTSEGEQRIIMRLSARSGATGRPDEVLEALGIDPYDARICRSELLLEE